MLKENIINNHSIKKQTYYLNLAKILISLSVYIFTAAVLIEHFNFIFVLKSIAFMLSAHGFYFLYQYQKHTHPYL